MNRKNTVGLKRIKPNAVWIPRCLITGLLILIISPSDLGASVSAEGKDISCNTDEDCESENQWIYPYQQCSINGTCECGDGTCTHFTTNPDSRGGDLYFCGECGEIGSNCTHDDDCMSGVCWKYCQCRVGNLFVDVCVHLYSVSYYRETYILCAILVFIIVLIRLFKYRKALKKLVRRIICCERQEADDTGTVVGYNPDSQEKSAAYTISSREFIASSDDPDLEWALELSTQLASGSHENQLEGARARYTHRTREFIRRHRNIRREFNEYNRGSFSSRSSTRSIYSVRSTAESSAFSSAQSSCFSTPRSSMRSQALNDNRRVYYNLSEEPVNSQELVITRILIQRNFSSSPAEETSLSQSGARPKQNRINRFYDTSEATGSNTKDNGSTSNETSSNYSSTRSTFSRKSNTDSNTNENVRTLPKNVSPSSASSSRPTKSLTRIRKNKEILDDREDLIKEESSDNTSSNL